MSTFFISAFKTQQDKNIVLYQNYEVHFPQNKWEINFIKNKLFLQTDYDLYSLYGNLDDH